MASAGWTPSKRRTDRLGRFRSTLLPLERVLTQLNLRAGAMVGCSCIQSGRRSSGTDRHVDCIHWRRASRIEPKPKRCHRLFRMLFGLHFAKRYVPNVTRQTFAHVAADDDSAAFIPSAQGCSGFLSSWPNATALFGFQLHFGVRPCWPFHPLLFATAFSALESLDFEFAFALTSNNMSVIPAFHANDGWDELRRSTTETCVRRHGYSFAALQAGALTVSQPPTPTGSAVAGDGIVLFGRPVRVNCWAELRGRRQRNARCYASPIALPLRIGRRRQR